WSADAQYLMAHRLSLFGAVYGHSYDFRNQPGPTARNDYGAMVEGGYSINDAWQLVARYSVSRLDSDFAVNGEDTFHELGVGVNWFFLNGGASGNHAKFSFDLNYLPNGTPAASGLDYLGSAG